MNGRQVEAVFVFDRHAARDLSVAYAMLVPQRPGYDRAPVRIEVVEQLLRADPLAPDVLPVLAHDRMLANQMTRPLDRGMPTRDTTAWLVRGDRDTAVGPDGRFTEDAAPMRWVRSTRAGR